MTDHPARRPTRSTRAFTARIRVETYEALRQSAKRNRRSLTAELELLVERGLERDRTAA